MSRNNKKVEAEIQEQLQKEREVLDAIAKKYNVKKVIELKVPRDDTYESFAIGYMKYPDREDVSIAMTMSTTDPLKGKMVVLENNWLEGDRGIMDDTELFLSACTILDDVLAVRQAIIKKNW